MGVLDAMIRYGISLARSVELIAQWDKILAVGPCILSLIDDLGAVQGLDIGAFHRVVSDFHHRLSDFSMLLCGGIGFGRILWFIHESGFVLIWFPLLPFSSVSLILRLADPARIVEEFRKAWLPYFCRSGQREASFDEFDPEVDGWLPLLPEVSLPRLTGRVLAVVVQRKGAAAGSHDGWGWREELKVLLVSWYDELARILSKFQDTEVWPEGLLDAYIAMIPRMMVMLPPLVRSHFVCSLLCIVFGLLLV